MKHFFSCDWGTTSFRLRQVTLADGVVIVERREAAGAKTLLARCAPGDTVAREKVFADFLREQLRLLAESDPAALAGATVVVSGMASSSVGWRELPYARTPFALNGADVIQQVVELDVGGSTAVQVQLVSGVCTADDIMRGEETELLGVFAEGGYAAVAANGIAILPGTHSKHVRLEAGRITNIRTFMTGELFDVLASHSLLKASVETKDEVSLTEASSREAFAEGVRAAMTCGLAAGLFQVRARAVLHGADAAQGRAFLRGLVIGAELEGLGRASAGVQILLAAPEPARTVYQWALETLGPGRTLTVVPPQEMALASVRGQRSLLRRGFSPR